jgi:hypothetical protein
MIENPPSWTEGLAFAQQAVDAPNDPATQAIGVIGLICFGLIGLLIYFLPSFIAIMRGHPNWLAIVALDILAGWTFIGWVAALVWSLTSFPRPVDEYAKTAGPGSPHQVGVGPPRGTSSGMSAVWIVLAVLFGIGLFIVLIACGIGLLVPAVQRVREAADRTRRMNDLQQVGVAIHSYYNANKQMPAKADDLKPFLAAPTEKRLLSGEIEVIWNAEPSPEQNAGKSKVIIGWDTAPAFGGNHLVLFSDGEVQQLSDDAFRNAPKAKTQMREEKKGDIKKLFESKKADDIPK